MAPSRREFLIVSGGTLAASALNLAHPSPLRANPLGRPIGLELYTVNAELDKDYEGTLKKVAEVGYTEIEAGVSPKRSAADAKKAFDAAGLKCHSIHIGMGGIEEAIPYAKELGAKYVISSVTFPAPPKPGPDGKIDMKALFAQISSLTPDDFRLIAARCNDMGKKAKDAGLQFGYHNHNFEFKPQPDGSIGYDTVLKGTDPSLVTFELDCGWMAAAGHSPAEYLTKYSNRYSLLHIKDFLPTSAPSTGLSPDDRPKPAELGRGHIDYKPIFAAAKKANIDFYYVEQEPPFTTTPALEAIKIDYDYLHAMA
jgi:sugar phosphate isomerase/epimerase